MGDNMFRLKDRKGADLCLGMTHEEVMTEIARKELRSYKQLPQIWYQIQTKFRDEPRPKSGLLRVRQFIMKDSYSFDIDAAGLDVSYQKHYDAYCRIFDRCGLKYMVVEAHSGAMGGSQSHEFMVRTPAGEDLIVSCEKCNYAANLEKATSKLGCGRRPQARRRRQAAAKCTRPGMKTIEDVAHFLGVSPKNKMKTLALMANETDAKTGKTKLRAGRPADARRSSDERGQALQRSRRTARSAPCTKKKSKQLFNSPAGFLGPIGIDWAKELRTTSNQSSPLVDEALEGRKNLISGANKEDYHLKNVTPGRELSADGLRRPAQCHCRRSLPELRRAAAHRHRRRNRPHLQARLQVFRIDGRARARQATARKSCPSWAATASGSSAS